MDEGTQQNAALVEEATAAARALEQQSADLVQTVAAFRLGAGDPAGAVAAIGRDKKPQEHDRGRGDATTALTAKPARPHRPVATAKRLPARPILVAAGGDQHWEEF